MLDSRARSKGKGKDNQEQGAAAYARPPTIHVPSFLQHSRGSWVPTLCHAHECQALRKHTAIVFPNRTNAEPGPRESRFRATNSQELLIVCACVRCTSAAVTSEKASELTDNACVKAELGWDSFKSLCVIKKP